jgi:hypothetical protein
MSEGASQKRTHGKPVVGWIRTTAATPSLAKILVNGEDSELVKNTGLQFPFRYVILLA